MTFFKICGIRDVDSAIIATESGASFLGFVFVPGVSRQISITEASELIAEYRKNILSGAPSLVGLFANQTIEEINEVVFQCNLDYVQLCGDESPDYWKDVKARVIKQIKIPVNLDQKESMELIYISLDKITKAGAIPLLDRFEEGKLGGTGKAFNWNFLTGISERYDFILAGGLTADNVGEAINISIPWCVDVSSGIEKNGAKDRDLIIEFAQSVNKNNY